MPNPVKHNEQQTMVAWLRRSAKRPQKGNVKARIMKNEEIIKPDQKPMACIFEVTPNSRTAYGASVYIEVIIMQFVVVTTHKRHAELHFMRT
eukprot:CAMPEP_0169093712 /NCGR_PEP_ID=MMETSP1015-20121227/17582_1 /TAXON_ID=342587 /ORGANISM="Karlodinium micrum, Strain CCMP2283" /LENGTH=91 /DNA_ID=CAMNT_0009154369 /DNA_START=179 /DNA_END=454 /DNA_ORIENTATION=+